MGCTAGSCECAVVCIHVFIHVLGERNTTFLSLHSEHELSCFISHFYRPEMWQNWVSVRSQWHRRILHRTSEFRSRERGTRGGLREETRTLIQPLRVSTLLSFSVHFSLFHFSSSALDSISSFLPQRKVKGNHDTNKKVYAVKAKKTSISK